MNANLVALHSGKSIRLELSTSNGGRSEPEFASTVREARQRKSVLQSSGYVVSLFKITESGGLETLKTHSPRKR